MDVYCILLNRSTDLVGRAFTNGLGDWGSITGRVISKTLKWYLMSPCSTLSIIRYRSSVKWSNPGKGVAYSPTPRCSSYWKGSFRVALYYGCQIYLYIYIYIYMLAHRHNIETTTNGHTSVGWPTKTYIQHLYIQILDVVFRFFAKWYINPHGLFNANYPRRRTLLLLFNS